MDEDYFATVKCTDNYTKAIHHKKSLGELSPWIEMSCQRLLLIDAIREVVSKIPRVFYKSGHR